MNLQSIRGSAFFEIRLCRPIRRCFEPGELAHVEFPIPASVIHQAVMGSPLDDPAIFDDQDLIGALDRTEPMRDDEAGSAFHQFEHRLLDVPFGPGIHAACSLVQDENCRIREDRPCDCQELPLPLAEVAALLREDCIISLGKMSDEVVSVGLSHYDRTRIYAVEAGEKGCDGGFTGSGAPYQRHRPYLGRSSS